MKRAIFTLLFQFLYVALAHGQDATTKVHAAASLPSTCTAGAPNIEADTLIVGDAYYICTTTNKWTMVSRANSDNVWATDQRFKGADPWFDITAFGARAVVSAPTTTASCNGTTTVRVASTSGFRVGDGVVVYGCGATETMTTPNAPSVTPGISNTLTVPDAILTPATGSTTYSYKLVAKDKFGGLTLPSIATTISSGLRSLGQQSLAVTSESLTKNILSVVLSTTSSLVAGELIHIKGSTNATLSGWFVISSVAGSGQDLTINNYPVYASSTIVSTGGTLTSFAGNQLNWKGANGVWQYIVCASRPGDLKTYHVIGLSFPQNAAGYASSTTFTDWGATLTSAPPLPSYITDSVCTAGAPTNDYLSATISNISGTTLTLTSAATQTISGQRLLFDDAPGILAAATAAHGGSHFGNLFIPASSSGYFWVNSFLNLSPFNELGISQVGVLELNETLIPTDYWYGFIGGGYSNTPGSAAIAPVVAIGTAWPGVYIPASTPFFRDLSFSVNNGNQSLPILWDGEEQGSSWSNLNIATGGSSDYSGMGLVIRAGPFFLSLNNVSISGGPGNSAASIDTTWTPGLYLARNPNAGSAPYSVNIWKMQKMQFYARGIYLLGAGGNAGASEIDGNYTQGGILPLITVQGSGSTTLRLNNFTNDTSALSYLSYLGGGILDVTMQGMNTLSAEAPGGANPPITGTAPSSLHFLDNFAKNAGLKNQTTPLMAFANSSSFGSENYYANDYFDTGKFNLNRGIQIFTTPVASLSGVFVPLGLAVQSIPTVSAGGGVMVGAHVYCVMPVGWNGGWGAASCQSTTTTSVNRTVNLSWAAVKGAQGYVVTEDGNKCIPIANESCTGISTNRTSLVYRVQAGCCYSVANPTASADGVQGFNANGLFGSRLALYTTTVAALPPAGVANAGQFQTVSDSTSIATEGQTCVGGSSDIALAFSNGKVWKCF